MARDETCRGAQCGGAEGAEESRCCRCRHDREGGCVRLCTGVRVGILGQGNRAKR